MVELISPSCWVKLRQVQFCVPGRPPRSCSWKCPPIGRMMPIAGVTNAKKSQVKLLERSLVATWIAQPTWKKGPNMSSSPALLAFLKIKHAHPGSKGHLVTLVAIGLGGLKLWQHSSNMFKQKMAPFAFQKWFIWTIKGALLPAMQPRFSHPLILRPPTWAVCCQGIPFVRGAGDKPTSSFQS